MTDIDLYQIDAFTDTVFGGNPAAVCPLQEWLPDELLKKIAAENNLSETAFFVPDENGFHLRWFTPTTEIDLCGHATLASAYCIFENLGFTKDTIIFQSRSGELSVKKTDSGYTLNFPKWNYTVQEDVSIVEDILGMEVKTVLNSTKTFAILNSAEEVQNYVPDIAKINTLTDTLGLVITARGSNDIDFVSRLFAPQIGIDEDPVTGAIHCCLTPYWGSVLDKTTMNAQQLSARGGNLLCTLNNDRVEISGKAVLYMHGKIYV